MFFLRLKSKFVESHFLKLLLTSYMLKLLLSLLFVVATFVIFRVPLQTNVIV